EDGIRDFHVTGVQTCALPIFVLEADLDVGVGIVGAARVHFTIDALRGYRDLDQLALRKLVTAAQLRIRLPDRLGADRVLRGERQIGRASCRERVESAGGDGRL